MAANLAPRRGMNVLRPRLEAALGASVTAARRLGGGFVEVWRVGLADRRAVVVKHGRSRVADHLMIEARMLRDLAARTDLPVPEVLCVQPDLLVMTALPGETTGLPDRHAERHAGELVAALHARPADGFGYAYDTVIGALPQPNPERPSWRAFFAEARLLAMARAGAAEGRVPAPILAGIERLAERVDDHLTEPAAPALLHGDLWDGNFLTAGGRVVGVIDPALYHGHPEIELAFGTLFHTFGDAFFEAYAANAPFDPEFFELRRDLYNLYPLLVHARLFGGQYLEPIRQTLARVGCA